MKIPDLKSMQYYWDTHAAVSDTAYKDSSDFKETGKRTVMRAVISKQMEREDLLSESDT